jgi:hypothetical protein
MKEKSQIDAMRAAIRGDLERSRARQDAVEAVQPEPEDAPELEDPPEPPAGDQPRPSIFSSLFRRR